MRPFQQGVLQGMRWGVVALVDIVIAVYVWNALAPDGWQWLSPDQFETIRTMVLGFCMGWALRELVEALRKR